MDPSKTLWMGNLESRMDEKYVRDLFNKLSK